MVADIILPPDFQEGSQSVVSRWLKRVGEEVHQYEPVVEIATDKVSVEIPSPITGVLTEIAVEEKGTVVPGTLLGRVSGELERMRLEEPRFVSRPSSQEQVSPAVRKLAGEHGVDLREIKGSGRGGRVTHDDVMRFVESRGAGGKSEASGQSRFVPHSPMRLGIARHMTESLLKTAPHVTAVFDADLSALIADREERKHAFAEEGIRLTYTPYFVLAAVKAVAAVPEVNSRWHADKLEIFGPVHIGIATAVPDSLIVPVLRDAQNLTLSDIAWQLQSLIERARAGALAPGDVQGGTFTITNHGMSGSLLATPIIHQPQSAILGIGKVEKRTVVRTEGGRDEVQIRPMAYVTLTIDHRVLDGFRANTFLSAFVSALEGPF